MNYLAVIEHEGESWGAYVPDLPGCVAIGTSQDEVRKLIAEAVPLHVESLRSSGAPVPHPTSLAVTIEAA